MKGRRYWWFYSAWILFTAIMFFAYRGAEDPSRRTDRMRNMEAARIAIDLLRATDRVKYADFEAVHVAYAPKGEVGPTARWVVLCDRRERTALAEAVVVELEPRDGTLIRIRPAVDARTPKHDTGT